MTFLTYKSKFWRLIVISILTAACYATAVQAQPFAARHGLSGAAFQTEFTKWTGQGYRLIDVCGYTVGGQERFAGVWEKSPGPAWSARHGMSGADYQAEFTKMANQGYLPARISGYSVNGQDKYAVIWEKGSGAPWAARHNMSAADYQTEFNKWTGQGYRLTEVCGYTVGGDDRYAAVWEKSAGPAWVAKHNMSAAQYQTEFNTYTGQGYRLARISGYSDGGQERYAAIWDKSAGPAWAARHAMTSGRYQDEFDNFSYQGYQPVQVCGFSLGNDDRFAAIWKSTGMSPAEIAKVDGFVKTYMTNSSIPGLSIAFAKEGRLVFAKGYGMADQANNEIVSPRNLFRVASVSKPLTSVAIFTLIHEGKIKLTDKVFGTNGILGYQYCPANEMTDKVNFEKITVQNLLEHASGWTNTGGDPMFDRPMNETHAQVIGWMLRNRKLENAPGTTYMYLNFGYCLLGRIIEKVTGQTYENYLRNNIFSKCGITKMQLTGNTPADRRPDEVVYYGSGGYSYNYNRMDAHGGWIASPIDLLRLMVRVDRDASPADILTSTSMDSMLTQSMATGAGDYARGWGAGNGYWRHNGCMPGTLAFMGRSGSYTFAVMINIRPGNDDCTWNGMWPMLNSIIGANINWPAYDLF